MNRKTIPIVLSLALAAPMVLAHGDTVPQAVDTAGLPDLPEEMAKENPWRAATGDVLFKAVEVGAKGFNSNCARCHGLEAISGGLAPDLRYLEANDFGDEWYLDRVLHGYEQNGAVKMPPFADIFNQQAVWAIRTYIETRPDADEMAGKSAEIHALLDKVKALEAGADAAAAGAVADELDTANDQFAALSGAPKSVTVLAQAAHILRADPARATVAAELIAGSLRD
ncbi:cytochrome c-550 PedF [Gemmobacter serpentinus]|uniref:cytochrome c-550 PedF n=1 Tax=Gemmobacter serpentinus TaxID=2652247 RepID=UPI001CF67BEF|nr:cytochrome c-550 PedF [Gemmobacter serpentinus]